jgi:phage terminase large subunit
VADAAVGLEEELDPRISRAGMGRRIHAALFSSARHKALHGGRGSAKSWSVATYLAMTASNVRKRIVCARQFQNSIRDSSKELVEKRIEALGLSRQFTITDRYIFHNVTQSQFLFVGLERNIDSIRSLEGADVVWIDEARTISSKSMEILLPTIRKPGSEFIWTWNPQLPDDPVDVYFRGPNGPPPRSVVLKVGIGDNPFFYLTEMPAEMETLKRGNFERYKHVWLGEYDSRHESKVFTNVEVGRPYLPSNTPCYYGLDFGFGSDPSFCVKAYINEKAKEIYVASEATGKVPMDHLPSLIRSVVNNDGDIIRADSSQPGTIEFLATRGINVIPARKGPGSIKAGINFLQGYKIWIDPDCRALQEEARLYSWMTDKMTGMVIPGNPVDAYNHGLDALRYAVEDAAYSAALTPDPSGGVIKLKWR